MKKFFAILAVLSSAAILSILLTEYGFASWQPWVIFILAYVFAASAVCKYVLDDDENDCDDDDVDDDDRSYDYAYISMPDGTCVEGVVDLWSAFEDCNQLLITINGVTYFTDTTRAVLVNNVNQEETE